jgi:hypothetical protein
LRSVLVVALVLVAGCGSAAATTPNKGVPFEADYMCVADSNVPIDESGPPPSLCFGTLVYDRVVVTTDARP